MADRQRQGSRRNFSGSTFSSTWSSTSRLVRESLPWVLHGHALRPQPEIRRSKNVKPESPRKQARKRHRLGLKFALLTTRRKKDTSDKTSSQCTLLDLPVSIPFPTGYSSCKEKRIRQLLDEIDTAIVEVDRLLDEMVLDNGLHRSPVFPIANLFCKDRNIDDTLYMDDSRYAGDIAMQNELSEPDSPRKKPEPIGRMAFEGQQRWTIRLVEPEFKIWEGSDTGASDMDRSSAIAQTQLHTEGNTATSVVCGRQGNDTEERLCGPLQELDVNMGSPPSRRRNVLQKKRRQ